MAKNEKTSKDVASTAGKLLATSKSPAVKKVAASVLTQAPDKPRKSSPKGKGR